MSRRRPARSSDLYQVDFVAALFCGFLLIWLIAIGEKDAKGIEGSSPQIFEISGKAVFAPKTAPGSREWYPVLPDKVVLAGCAHDRLVTKLQEVGSEAVACKSSGVERLQHPHEQKKRSYQEMVVAGAARTFSAEEFVLAVGIDLEVYFPDDKAAAPLAGLGLFVRSAEDLNSPSVGSKRLDPRAIGISQSDKAPTFLRIKSPELSKSSRWSLFSANAGQSSLNPVATSDYIFVGINRTVRPGSTEVQPPTFEFVVRTSLSQGNCFAATTSAGFSGDLPLRPAACP